MANIYHTSKIYKIVDNGYNKTYYGSTTQSLCARMAGHRRCYRSKCQKKCSVVSIFDEFGFENCKIELVQPVKCENRDELRKIEGYYIKNNECVNKKVAGRTKTENNKIYRDNNVDKILEYRKEYMDKNKEAVYKKKRRCILCECGSSINAQNKARHLKSNIHVEFVKKNIQI